LKKLAVLVTFGVLLVALILNVDWSHMRSWLSDITMPLRHGIYCDRNIMVRMGDGIELATTVFRPLSGDGPYPSILIRTTYGGTDFNLNKYFVKNGYAVIVQDVRGRFGSQGDIYIPHRYSRTDGYDTIDWIVRQSWSSGKVGTFGCSYLGENQIMLAATNHPNHIAMIASGAGGAIGKAKQSYGYFGLYENGVLNLASTLGWFTAEGATYFKVTPRPPDYEEKMKTALMGLPVSELAKNIVPYETGFDEFVSHPLTDSWWEEEGYINDQDTFSTATLHVNSWYDQTVYDTFRLAEHMAERAKHQRAKAQHVLIDPSVHCSMGQLKQGRVKVGEMEFQYKDPDFKKIYLEWFDYWLKGTKLVLPPRFRYFLIHSGGWETSNQWPPENVKFRRYYFGAEGALNLTRPKAKVDTQDPVLDQFIYDPLDPVPTIGGSICCTYRPNDIAGAIDQSQLKSRKDVLIFTSDELTSDLNLIGNSKATLHVSTTALDTDFTLKIVDQYPGGKAYNLQDGVVRLRYRKGIDNPQLAEPDKIYKIGLELGPIAYRFKKGHRIAAYISSSNFPRLARNLNTGEDEYKGTTTVVARNRIHRSDMHASYVELPIVVE
jgi:uncharacterized protein